MVSIIVTHKKGLTYLEDALESIAEQKFKEYETILVIDGNEDDPSAVIEKYKESANIKIYRLEGKSGVAAARNLGLKRATGEYVYFLDGDDYLYGETIAKLLDKMEESDDVAYGRLEHTWFQRKAFNDEQKDKEEDADEDNQEYSPEDILGYRFKRYKRLITITILGVLYKKSFLEKNDIIFDEEQPYYADSPFWTKVVRCQKGAKYVEDSIYVKRYHNDKESNPALVQIKDEKRRDYYIKAYWECIENAGDNEEIRLHLQNILCRYFVTIYCPHLKYDANDKSWRNERLVPFLEAVKATDNKCMKGYPFTWKRVVKAAKKDKIEAAAKWTNVRLAVKKMEKSFKDKKQLYRYINLHVFQKMKMKDNWIIFESFVGRNYAGQPKYIYKYLQENYGNQFRYIWITDKKGMQIDGKHTKVKRFGLRYFYYMSRSKYWVNNMRQPVWFPRHEGQIMLSTWHGTPLKRLVFDMDDVHSSNPRYKQIVYKQTRGWDYLLSDNPFSTEKFQSCFLFEKEKILEYGYPANDPMYYPNRDEIAAKVKEKLGIPKDKKVILYAPTWRDDSYYDAGQYKFELALDINRLKEEFGNEYVLLLRMHYWIVDHLDMSQFGDFTYDGSSYDDITELYLISDICMTDYSSVFFDYANLKRPILYYTYDLEKYRDVLRGFYLDMEKDLPGPLLLTNDDVVDAIKNIDKIEEQYKERYEEFYNRFCCRDDGFAAKRVVEKVFSPNKEKGPR